MLPRNHPDRIRIAFDDHRLVANAGPGEHRRQDDDPGGLRPSSPSEKQGW